MIVLDRHIYNPHWVYDDEMGHCFHFALMELNRYV